MTQWKARAVRWLVVMALVLAGGLAACKGESKDKGDPVAISRAFILALWSADTDRIEALSCEFTEWPEIGDPTVAIDVDHMAFETVSETDDEIVLAMTGVVTFKTAAGHVEVRNFDDENQTLFTLRDEDGWKVCDIQ